MYKALNSRLPIFSSNVPTIAVQKSFVLSNQKKISLLDYDGRLRKC